MTVRQVATDYPPCREIFVEYGEPTDRLDGSDICNRLGTLPALTVFAPINSIGFPKPLASLSTGGARRPSRFIAALSSMH